MLKGLTFDLQSNAGENDAQLCKVVRSNGIESGCAITNTATEIVLGAGYFNVEGRRFQIVGSETVSLLSPIADGYVRTKLVIDMTQAAAPVFAQGYWDYDYSATLEGFAALTQEDINDGGNTHIFEYEVAVHTIESSVVTGLVRSMGNSHPVVPLVAATLSTASWSGSEQIVTVTGVRPTSTILWDIDSESASADARAALRDAAIYATEVGTDEVTFAYDETEPTEDIPINILVLGQ